MTLPFLLNAMATEGVFQLDTEGDAASSSASDPVASGTLTPTSVREKSEVELSRKAIPVLEVEKDVCRWGMCPLPNDWHVGLLFEARAVRLPTFDGSLVGCLVAASAWTSL